LTVGLIQRAQAAYPETPDAFAKEYVEYGAKASPADYKDSFKYYGPSGLWKTWTPQQRRGRDMWLFWTAGNQKFYRYLQVYAGNLPVPMSVDFYRLLDSRNRSTRFKDIGLINEPNFKPATKPDEYGLWTDEWQRDPLEYYPNHYYTDEHDLKKYWGEPTGIVGLRKFKNPQFKKESWNVKKYFENPGKIEPPYLVGITCGFCHVAFDPLNPPRDPENPRWENLAANIGNQYFDEGGLFFGRGRLAGGDRNLRKTSADADPYDTQGFGPESLLWHYGATQHRGTSETSRFSYDFINNPNTINSVFNLGHRVQFWEESSGGVKQPVFHILKDGADSTGAMTALQRVYVNIGAESEYWLDHLFDPVTGRRQRPMLVNEMRLQVSPERAAELEKKYHDRIYNEPFGADWKATEARIGDMLAYLISYAPPKLRNAPGGAKHIDDEKASRGATVFADRCARCHSNKQPPFYVQEKERREFYRALVRGDGFPFANTLTDDVRYSVAELGTNSQRAMATNAIDGDIWADVSSKDYKALPPVGELQLTIPTGVNKPSLTIAYTPKGGGRGYYRTASLAGIWATAPFLHNNSVGRQPLRKREGHEWAAFPNVTTYDTDPKAITVEGRLELFLDACEQLLSDRRIPDIKVTKSDSGLGSGAEALELALLKLIREYAVGLIEEKVTTKLVAEGLTNEEARTIVGALRTEIEPVIDQLVASKAALKSQQAPGGVSAEKLKAILGPKIARKAETVEEIKQLVEEKLDALQMAVPKNTPINVFFNQSVESLPYVAIALIRHSRKDANEETRQLLLKELLELSQCPDIVENRGHTYGADLSPADKLDLVEYLKTL